MFQYCSVFVATCVWIYSTFPPGNTPPPAETNVEYTEVLELPMFNI